MSRVLDPTTVAELAARLAAARPGSDPRAAEVEQRRQPAHVVYGGADRFRADTARRLGAAALAALDAHAATPPALAAAFGVADEKLAAAVHARVRAKLEREPVEDFRLDFEDGYGYRPDDEEDRHADAAARAAAQGLAAGTLPPFLGLRTKPLSPEWAPRALATLDRFVSTLVSASGGLLPGGFVVTLPKVAAPVEVATLAAALDELEAGLGLDVGSIGVELMVETPRAIFTADGRLALPELVEAAAGRCVGAHFGTYDYTAALGISAGHQRMGHPACDFAKHAMQVALAGSGVYLSDGATNVLPLGDDRLAVHAAWRRHAADVRHSLAGGFYQGWDLHPAQLVSRWTALYVFFLEGLDEASARLRNFVEQAARATRVGEVFDDAATGQGLINHFLRAIQCGALDAAEAERRTGLSAGELATRSFTAVLAARLDRDRASPR
jgi:hypothetical protein